VVDHREESLTGPLELLHFREEASTLLVMARIVDGRGSLARQQDSDVLVLLGERVAVNFLSKVEVPEYTPASENRNAKKRSHRWVVRRKSASVGMLGQIRQADRLRVSDDEAKDAVTIRRPADPGRKLRVDAVGREMLEHPTARCQNADGCIAGPDDMRRHFHGALKHTFERDLGDEGRGGRHELLESLLCGWKLHDGWQ
jgi:hypothetical protein